MTTDPLEPGAEAATADEPMTRLLDLPIGRCARIGRVLAGESQLQQLMAMGVCVGRSVMLIQRGDPLILRVHGTRIGVSERLAANVLVEPDARDECAGLDRRPCED